jgi:hypothetical protein
MFAREVERPNVLVVGRPFREDVTPLRSKLDRYRPIGAFRDRSKRNMFKNIIWICPGTYFDVSRNKIDPLTIVIIPIDQVSLGTFERPLMRRRSMRSSNRVGRPLDGHFFDLCSDNAFLCRAPWASHKCNSNDFNAAYRSVVSNRH